MTALTSWVQIAPGHPQLAQLLAPFLTADQVLQCRLVAADQPYYLHVEVPLAEDRWGTLLIPHHAVLVVSSEPAGNPLGFLAAAQQGTGLA